MGGCLDSTLQYYWRAVWLSKYFQRYSRWSQSILEVEVGKLWRALHQPRSNNRLRLNRNKKYPKEQQWPKMVPSTQNSDKYPKEWQINLLVLFEINTGIWFGEVYKYVHVISSCITNWWQVSVGHKNNNRKRRF